MQQLMKSNASKLPAVLLVLCGMSNTAYRRTDSVYAVPIPQLRDLFLMPVSGHFKTSARTCGALQRKILRSLAARLCAVRLRSAGELFQFERGFFPLRGQRVEFAFERGYLVLRGFGFFAV